MQQEKESSSQKEIPRTNLKQNEIDPLASRKSPGIGWGGAFCFLMLARYYSAMYNNIHDCDEVFNYWEPLHYLFHKSGFQTWEYRYVNSNLCLVWFGLVLDHLNSCWNCKGLVCISPCDAWSQAGLSDMGVQVCDYGAVVGLVGLVLNHLNSCWNFKVLECILPCNSWSQIGFSDMGVKVCDYGAVVGWVGSSCGLVLDHLNSCWVWLVFDKDLNASYHVVLGNCMHK